MNMMNMFEGILYEKSLNKGRTLVKIYFKYRWYSVIGGEQNPLVLLSWTFFHRLGSSFCLEYKLEYHFGGHE